MGIGEFECRPLVLVKSIATFSANSKNRLQYQSNDFQAGTDLAMFPLQTHRYPRLSIAIDWSSLSGLPMSGFSSPPSGFSPSGFSPSGFSYLPGFSGWLHLPYSTPYLWREKVDKCHSFHILLHLKWLYWTYFCNFLVSKSGLIEIRTIQIVY